MTGQLVVGGCYSYRLGTIEEVSIGNEVLKRG